MRVRPVVAAALTAAAVSAAGASAYTATLASTPGSAVVAYGVTTITGASFNTPPTFDFNAGHSTLTTIHIVLDHDTTGSTLSTSRNNAAPDTCSGAGSFDNLADTTTYACVVSYTVIGMTSLGYILN